MKKTYLTADQLLHDSYALAAQVIESGYRPSIIVGVWRGGSPIAIAAHELFEACGLPCDHIPVKTQSYLGIDRRNRTVKIGGMQALIDLITDQDRLLIVDDVHDTGLSMAALLDEIDQRAKPQTVKIATCYYKPSKSKTDFAPDYFVHQTDQWLVFPHELVGLSGQELLEHKPSLGAARKLIETHSNKNQPRKELDDKSV